MGELRRKPFIPWQRKCKPASRSIGLVMIITLNGQKKELKENMTVFELLQELGIEKKPLALELNLKVLPKVKYDVTYLRDGDRVEIINFVGGG